MKNLAVMYYQRGYGCSECILKAAETKYNFKAGNYPYQMLQSINSGFGVGGMCSVIIACVMIMGILFDQNTAKAMRIEFLSQVNSKLGSTNCSTLLAKRRGNRMCADMIFEVVEILDDLIERKK